MRFYLNLFLAATLKEIVEKDKMVIYKIEYKINTLANRVKTLMKIVKSTMSSQPFELIHCYYPYAEKNFDSRFEEKKYSLSRLGREKMKYLKYIQELLLLNSHVIKDELQIPSGRVFGSITIPEPGMSVTIEIHFDYLIREDYADKSEFLYTVCGESVNRYRLDGENMIFDLEGVLLVQDDKACLYWLDLARNDLFPVAGPQIDGPSAVDSSTNPPTIITITPEKILRRRVKNMEDKLVFEIVNEMPTGIRRKMEEVLVCERGLIFTSENLNLYIISPDFLFCWKFAGWRVYSRGRHYVHLQDKCYKNFKVCYKSPDL